MSRPLSLQAAGPALLVGFFMAAELASRVLEIFPASPLWWFVNLEVFRPLMGLRLVRGSVSVLFHPWSVWFAVLLMGGIIALDRLRARFALAVVANLGAVLAITAAYAWLVERAPRSASLLGAVTSSIDGFLVLVLVCTTAGAAMASHVAYWTPALSNRG